VIGHGVDGVVWDAKAGMMLQADLAAFVPGKWNHVVMQIYNEVNYHAYTKANGEDYWYWLGDNMNQNSFRYQFTDFIGYSMPIFLDLAGFQVSGNLPLYNPGTGHSMTKQGLGITLSTVLDFKLSTKWKIMAIVNFKNSLEDPPTSSYKRKWGLDRVQIIATYHLAGGK
jgi:hypothetical protein